MKKITATSLSILTFGAIMGLSLACMPHAQAKEPEVSFYPAQAWNVSKTKNASGAPECAISSEYNNGFIVAMNGSGKWVQNLNIDFRQSIFTPGDTYPITLSVPGQFSQTLQAKAATPTTIQADIRKNSDFYDAAIQAGVFDFMLDANNFRFYLTRFSSDRAGFEQCMAMQQDSLRSADAKSTGTDDLRVNEAMAYEQSETAMIAADDMAAPMPLTEKSETPAESAMPPLAQKTAMQDGVKPASETDVVTPEAASASDDMMTPEPQTVSASTPDFEVETQKYTAEADFTDLGTDMGAEPFSAPGRGEMARKISDLEDMVKNLKIEKELLEDELKSALRESEQERLSISSDNWNLERATMRFNEAERQADRLAQQLQRERAQCTLEKQELEAMLFDPQVTDQVQLAKLADMERQLKQANEELESQRLRFEERIRILEGQAGTN